MNARPPVRSEGLGPLERDVMDEVWRAGAPVAVRDVLDALNAARSRPLAYTTVMTVMSRLAEKGALERRREGRGFTYEAAASGPAALAVRNVVRQFGDAAIAEFLNEARTDEEMLRRLQRLIDQDA